MIIYDVVNSSIKTYKSSRKLSRGRYRIPQKRGRGVSRVWIFHTWTFCGGIYHAVHGQHTGGQNASQNCKGGQNAGHFMEQGGQYANIIKTFYILY